MLHSAMDLGLSASAYVARAWLRASWGASVIELSQRLLQTTLLHDVIRET